MLRNYGEVKGSLVEEPIIHIVLFLEKALHTLNNEISAIYRIDIPEASQLLRLQPTVHHLEI